MVNIFSKHSFSVLLLCLTTWSAQAAEPVDYVSTLVGTQSKVSLSTGNTYPAIAMPWGMNFWMPQTGKMGDGWAYTYDAEKIRGLKQTHQPSPWINDYGQFAIMPTTRTVFNENERASWFSHKAEVARPYYYKVYLADHDVTAEMAPTERAVVMRFTYPETSEARIVVDAFDNGSFVKVSGNKIMGYTTKNSGGVPANFKNYFFNLKSNFDPDWQVVGLVGLTYKFGMKKKAPAPVVLPPEPVVEPEPQPQPVVQPKPEPKPEPKPVVKEEPLRETFFYIIRETDPAPDVTLNKIVNWCNKYPQKSISIKGYADRGTGNPQINVGYAKARAEKVAKALEERGISKSRMDVESFGDTVQPFPENDRNRCVIVVGE